MKNSIGTKSVQNLNKIYLPDNYLKEQFLISLKNSAFTFIVFLSAFVLLEYLSDEKKILIDGLDIAIALVASMLMLIKSILKKLYCGNNEHS
jgi:hypothetical protein